MVQLKRSEMRVIEDAFVMNSGYVLDFSNRTFAEFFDDEFRLDIYSSKYDYKGSSKANHLRAFIESEDEYTVGRVLRALWSHRESNPTYRDLPESNALKVRLFELISRIEGAGAVPRTDSIDRFTRDETLEELVAAIERDISANKPVAALDRLHTFCMKKFGHLLDSMSIPWDPSEPLHSRVGKYFKALDSRQDMREMSHQIVRNSIGIFEKFNHVRNNDSLAHDNELLNHGEARFIFDSITAILRFIKSLESARFGQ